MVPASDKKIFCFSQFIRPETADGNTSDSLTTHMTIGWIVANAGHWDFDRPTQSRAQMSSGRKKCFQRCFTN